MNWEAQGIPMTICRSKAPLPLREQTPLLRCEKIAKSYGGEQIIRDISVSLFAGELVSVLGRSGTGKTTLFNILSGLETPDRGSVYLKGSDVTDSSGLVSYMQQKDLLLPFRTILDNVCVPLVLRGTGKKEAREYAQTYFEEFGLAGCEDKYPGQLSGGMRQRAALLRSYLFEGEIMLLDEPFSALDAITKMAMHRWYKEISRAHGTSAFLITHDIDEALLLSDRIYVITGSPGEICAEIAIEHGVGESAPAGSVEMTGAVGMAGSAEMAGAVGLEVDFSMSAEFAARKKEILAYIS